MTTRVLSGAVVLGLILATLSLDGPWLRLQVESAGFLGPVVFVCVGGPLTTFGLPRLALAALGGLLFGAVMGSALSLVGAAIGCSLAWLLARRLLGYLPETAQEVAGQVGERLQTRTFATAAALRLFPVGSNSLTNLAGGLVGVPLLPFLAGSVLGYIPSTIAAALAGAGAAVGHLPQLAAGVTFTGCLMALSLGSRELPPVVKDPQDAEVA